MVDVSDFGLINDFALENELPFSVVGYLQGGCANYVPPDGYAVVSCESVGNMIIGGSSRTNLYKVKIVQASGTNVRTVIYIGGIAVVLGIIAFAWWSKGRKKRYLGKDGWGYH